MIRLPLMFRVLIAIFAASGFAAWAAEPLSSIAQIRSLDAGQRELRLPVKLDAVVTFYHDAWGVMFVHDGENGICVGVPPELRHSNYETGADVHVEGAAGPGEFLPVVLPSSIRSGGTIHSPAWQRVSAAQLFEPEMDCHPVEVHGIVKSTSFEEASLVVELQIDGWLVKAVIPKDRTRTQLPWQFVEHSVKVHGVAGTHFNDQRQMSGRLLYVPGLDAFVLDDEVEPVAHVPLLPVDGLLRVDSKLRQRVRVQGVATHVVPGRGLYIRGEGGSMFVKTAQPITVKRSEQVEAEGYPQVTPFRPSLSATDVRVSGVGELPHPLEFHAARTRDSGEQCELVTLDAEFIEDMNTREGHVLVCRSEGQVFDAVLGDEHRLHEELESGMQLRVTGICEFSSTHPLVIPRNATGFSLQLRDADDVVVLARAPWWTESRARWLLGSLGLLALAIGAWAFTLQKVVRSQSSVIRAQAGQTAKLEERQRIARDLHDTLEQELVGVQMLLDNASMKLNGGARQVEEPLGVARKILRRAREESRSTIRELRSVALEQRGLAAGMDELLRPLATAGGAEFEYVVEGSPVRLAGALETQLLRIAQEAVANAARHGAARHIRLHLEYAANGVSLEVTDDGTGFDTSSTESSAGHFGLSGMRERADKIGASLRIESSAESGTRVCVVVPAGQIETRA